MARATLVKTLAPGGYAAAGVTVTMAAADVALGNQFIASGNDLLVAWNSGVGAPTITVESSDDERGREEDITTEAIAAGTVRIFGPFKTLGWRQALLPYIYVNGSSADILFGVIYGM